MDDSHHNGATRPSTTPPVPPSLSLRYPGPALRVAADYGWRLLVIGTAGYFVIELLTRLSEVVIPFVVAILVTALLQPLAGRLRRSGMPRGASTLVTIFVALAFIGGLLTIVIVRAAQQAPQLGDEINRLLPSIKHWLITGPLRINPKTVNNLDNEVSNTITKNSSAIASTALSTGKTVLQLLTGLVLAIFSVIFLVYDGDRVWSFVVKGAPVPARPAFDAAGRAAWTTVSHYVRGTLIVALFHGVVVAVTLTILGVPLAFPLAVLVALGSFIPLVGAVVTGTLAAAVAGLSHGLVGIIVVIGVLLLDNQIEAHVLQPFVVGRYVRIHALAVVLSLAAGGILFGIVGALVAVPVVATVNSAARAAMASIHGETPEQAEDEGAIGPPGVDDDPLVTGGAPPGTGTDRP